MSDPVTMTVLPNLRLAGMAAPSHLVVLVERLAVAERLVNVYGKSAG
ncbi:hypothetical protein [Rhodanobacter hydrolyticus]|uniref:Uncharacterized protein n=1 Tax=Rhodanobacter hydrolyticus TaxID=2250595 RepID=A0ABW8J8J1_9GAMM